MDLTSPESLDMPITGSGEHLSPWRRQVMPWLMALLRAFIAFALLRVPVISLWQNPLLLRGLAPHFMQYVLIALVVVAGLAFVLSRTVIWGAVGCIVTLVAFDYRLSAFVVMPQDRTLFSSMALIAVLTVGELLARRVQRQVYGRISR